MVYIRNIHINVCGGNLAGGVIPRPFVSPKALHRIGGQQVWYMRLVVLLFFIGNVKGMSQVAIFSSKQEPTE
jgi:hypothetical protein